MPAHIKASLLGPSLSLPVPRRAARARHVAGRLPLRAPQPRRGALAARHALGRVTAGPYAALVAAHGLSPAHRLLVAAVPGRRAHAGRRLRHRLPRRPSSPRAATRSSASRPTQRRAAHAEAACERVVAGDVEGAASRAELRALGPFDAIVCGDRARAICATRGTRSRSSRTLLRPGGIAAVSVPNVAHWTGRRALLRGRFPYAEHGLFEPHAPALLHAGRGARGRRGRAAARRCGALRPRAAAAAGARAGAGAAWNPSRRAPGPSSSRFRSVLVCEPSRRGPSTARTTARRCPKSSVRPSAAMNACAAAPGRRRSRSAPTWESSPKTSRGSRRTR
jgi:hypothetical protein